ncbi:origin recognition complex subunit 1-like [Dysidea avara]|uniref:origin recognition complex subunit 1-like n=1 Tax=Dysidea avara TaxID=196820 RepID=UPI00331A1EE4
MLWTRRQTVYYSIFEWCTWPDTPLILLAIANTMDLPERMLIGRITSRLGLTRLNFLPYDFKQLMEILSARLEDLKVFEHDSIVLSARKVAAISGDARKALDICRRATEVAEKQGCSTVNTRHIDTVVKEMFFSPKVMAVKCASVQEQLLLQSVQAELIRLSSEETTLEQVYSTYCNHCTVKGVVHQLSLSELSSVCWRLADIRLLSLNWYRSRCSLNNETEH